MQHAAESFHVHARPQAQVDAVDPAQPLEPPLGGGDVHHADPLAVRAFGKQPDDAQLDRPRADVYAQNVSVLQLEPLGRRRAQQDGVGVEQINDRAPLFRQQRRLHLRRAQRIEPDDLERGFAAGERYLELDRGIGRLDLRHARDARVEALVETRPRAAHHQIGLTRKMVCGEAHLVQRAGVDEMDCNTQSHSQGDREQREQGAARVLAERAAHHCGE